MRRDLGLKRHQGFPKACDMRLQVQADAGIAGMLQPEVSAKTISSSWSRRFSSL